MVSFKEALSYVTGCAESEKVSLIDPTQAILANLGLKKKIILFLTSETLILSSDKPISM